MELSIPGAYESTRLTTLLSWVVPILIFFGIWTLIFRRMSPGGTVMTIGRSKAKIHGENEVGQASTMWLGCRRRRMSW